MAEDDNFDIDIYGDDSYQESAAQQDTTVTDANAANSNSATENATTETGDQTASQEVSAEATNGNGHQDQNTQQIASTGGASGLDVHKQAPQQQGTKRKQGEDDDRPTDPGATSALMINDINWWISEEDIRGWANQSGCEDELIEVTFNEHKVNGKSKGQVFTLLNSPQAATALKHQIETLFKDQAHTKKPTAIFSPPHVNPFKTLPKDVPARDKGRNDRASSGNFNNQGGFNNRGGYNNNRGNFNRGGMGYQNNRNFSPAGGNMGGNMGGYGAQAPMNNFGNPMGMNNFGNNFNRGGMMGGNMRGGMGNRGRGGNMGMNPMGGAPMGGMNMPMGGNMMGMGGNMMGMGGGNMGMMGGMGSGFGGNPGFNPGFFQGNQGGNDGSWQNPHGAKRPRPE